MFRPYLIFFLTLIYGIEGKSQNANNSSEVYRILEKVIEARGGRDYLGSIKTFYAEMKVESPNGVYHTVTKEMVPDKGFYQEIRNGKIVYESRSNGLISFASVDGQTFVKDSTKLATLIARKNIFTELDYVDTALWKMQLLGSEYVEKTDCFKVKGTNVNGVTRIIYIDKKMFWVIKMESINPVSKRVYLTNYYFDFKKYGDFFFYSRVYFVSDEMFEITSFEKVLVNELVEASDFEL